MIKKKPREASFLTSILRLQMTGKIQELKSNDPAPEYPETFRLPLSFW